MTELALTLMRKDGLSEAEALEMEQKAREASQEALMNGDDPEEVFMDSCGLEPDCILLINPDLRWNDEITLKQVSEKVKGKRDRRE